MMAKRSVENWIHVFQGKTDYQIAQQIIGDLTGYRSTSLHRAEDTDSLHNAVQALLQANAAPTSGRDAYVLGSIDSTEK